MTTAETSAPPFDPSLAESTGGILRKWVAPFAVVIARAYTNEHAQLIRGDVLGMANDIARAQPLFYPENGWARGTFRELLTASATSRNLPSAVLIDKERNVLESAQTGVQLPLAP